MNPEQIKFILSSLILALNELNSADWQSLQSTLLMTAKIISEYQQEHPS